MVFSNKTNMQSISVNSADGWWRGRRSDFNWIGCIKRISMERVCGILHSQFPCPVNESLMRTQDKDQNQDQNQEQEGMGSDRIGVAGGVIAGSYSQMKARKAAQQLYICNKLLHGTLHVFILIGFSCTSQCLIRRDEPPPKGRFQCRYSIPSANGCSHDTGWGGYTWKKFI